MHHHHCDNFRDKNSRLSGNRFGRSGEGGSGISDGIGELKLCYPLNINVCIQEGLGNRIAA